MYVVQLSFYQLWVQFLQEHFLTWKQTVCCNTACKRYAKENHVDTSPMQT